MRRVLISVEGQTEETFIREVIAPHLWELNIDPVPVLVATSRIKQGNRFKGGLVSFGKAKNDVERLLRDSSAAAVTTFYDFYHLPSDFPGQATKPKRDCYARVEHLESALESVIANRRFKAFFQLHEFEAFLFVSPEITAEISTQRKMLPELKRIRDQFNSPEEINEGETTAPSKRILALYPGYQKNLDGPLVALQIGLDVIRKQCAHFDKWMKWLEVLAEA